MLGLYPYNLKIGHKSCNILSILNKLTLQKEFQNLMTQNLFWIQSENTTTTTKQ